MKKKYILIIAFIVISKLTYSQFFTYPFADFPGLDSSFYNGSYSGGLLLSHSSGSYENCADWARVIFVFDDAIDYTQDDTFNDYYHTLQVEVYGFNDNKDTPVLVKTINFNLSDYDITVSSKYSYSSGYFDLPEPLFEQYGIKSIMKEYRIVGYPDLIHYSNFVTYKDESIVDYEKLCKSDSTNTDNDTDPNAKPNLTLSNLTIKVGSKTYDVKGKGEIPEFKHGENHTFNITIKNDDEGNASNSKYTLFVSEENKYPDFGSKPVHTYRTVNVPSIAGNNERNTTFSQYVYDWISTLSLENDKTYYMFLDIDIDGNIDESNETDNLFKFQFKYKKADAGKIAIKVKSSGQTIYVNYDNYSNINNLRILNLSNRSLVYSSNIYGLNPTVSINSVPNGLYAIYLNNVYLKKIGILGGIPDRSPLPIPTKTPTEFQFSPVMR